MLCYVTNKAEFDLIDKGYKKEIETFICIGSVEDVEEGYKVANALPCLTEVKVLGIPNKICCIVCNP